MCCSLQMCAFAKRVMFFSAWGLDWSQPIGQVVVIWRTDFPMLGVSVNSWLYVRVCEA